MHYCYYEATSYSSRNKLGKLLTELTLRYSFGFGFITLELFRELSMSDSEEFDFMGTGAKPKTTLSKSVSSDSSNDSGDKSPSPTKGGKKSPVKQKIADALKLLKILSPKSKKQKSPSKSAPTIKSPSKSPRAPPRECRPVDPRPAPPERIFEFIHLDRNVIMNFLKSTPCYAAMPDSGKVVILSTELPLASAFECIVLNGFRSAPLWDSCFCKFVGMLTATDLIDILMYYNDTVNVTLDRLLSEKVKGWRARRRIPENFIAIHPQESLYVAVKMLVQQRLHRLPIVDENNNCLFILTKKILLHYICKNMASIKALQFMEETIESLRSSLGTWENFETISASTTLIEALRSFSRRRVSGLPIIRKDKTIGGIFTKTDVFGLAEVSLLRKLNMGIIEALDKTTRHEIHRYCHLDDTFGDVLGHIIDKEANRVSVLGERLQPPKLVGIISLTDILKFLVPMNPESAPSTDSEREVLGAEGGSENSSRYEDALEELAT